MQDTMFLSTEGSSVFPQRKVPSNWELHHTHACAQRQCGREKGEERERHLATQLVYDTCRRLVQTVKCCKSWEGTRSWRGREVPMGSREDTGWVLADERESARGAEREGVTGTRGSARSSSGMGPAGTEGHCRLARREAGMRGKCGAASDRS